MRKFLVLLVSLVAVAALFYFFIGRLVIGVFYRAESLGPLEMFFDGRRIHPLSFYLQKGDILFGTVLIWGLVTAVVLGVARSLIRFLDWRRHHLILNTLVFSVSLLGSLVAAELVARAAGLKPLHWNSNQPEVSPGGRLMRNDPKFGYVLLPGSFSVKWPTGYISHSTHSAEGRRITHPPRRSGEPPKKNEIWLFGCSFTYGMSLNDNETYAWKLQEMFPDDEVVNFAVPGYGTYQSLMQFEEVLQKGNLPLIAVYAYASLHDERNTLLRKRQKGMAMVNPFGYRQPYVRLDRKGEFTHFMDDLKYRPFPLARQSALAHLIEERLDEFEDYSVHSGEVTRRLIQRFEELAGQNHVRFIVAGIDSDSAKTLRKLEAMRIKTVDISVDLSTRENRNWPHDSHPNAAANRKYARKLLTFIITLIK